MPPAKRARSTLAIVTTKNVPKKKVINRKPTAVRVGRQLMPKQIFNTLKYVDTVTVALSSGEGAQLYSANGLFDPNVTGSGHQPLGFDQMMLFYHHYTAITSRIKVTFLDASVSSKFLFGLGPTASTTPPAGVLRLMEQPGAVSITTTDRTVGKSILRKSWSAMATFGGDPKSDPVLQGDVANNPAEQTFWTIQIQDLTLGASSIDIVVEIEYDVFWDELKVLAQS